MWMNDLLDTSKQTDRCWFHVYLDNFCAGERIVPGDSGIMGHMCHEAAEQAWENAGVVSSSKKKVSAAQHITELGADVCGETKTLGVSLAKIHKLTLGLWWVAGFLHFNFVDQL